MTFQIRPTIPLSSFYEVFRVLPFETDHQPLPYQINIGHFVSDKSYVGMVEAESLEGIPRRVAARFEY